MASGNMCNVGTQPRTLVFGATPAQIPLSLRPWKSSLHYRHNAVNVDDGKAE